MSTLPLIIALLVASPGPAAPPEDPLAAADALVAEGVALGRANRFDEAILRFEAADRLFPRAIHVCNIGLAHARADRPEKAHFYLLRCQARATEPLPTWVERRLGEARRALERGPFAPVEVIGPPSTLQVSHFGPEPLTPPLTLWLPLGTHRLSASADGFLPLTQALIVTARSPMRHVYTLEPKPTPIEVVEPTTGLEPDPPPDPEPAVATPRPEALASAAPTPPGADVPGLVLTVAGGVALVTGLVLYPVALASRDRTSELASGDLEAYQAARSAFELERGFAYGLTLGGAVLTTAGAILLLTGDDPPPIGFAPSARGALAYTTLRF